VEYGAVAVDEVVVVADVVEDVEPVLLLLLQPPPLPLALLLLQMPLLKRRMTRNKSLLVAVADVDEEERVMRALKRKRKRRMTSMLFPSTKIKNSTRTARNCAATSATAANATSVTSVIIPTRPDLQLGILSSPVVVDDEILVVVVPVAVNPKHLVSASISVTTRSVSTEMNADSSMARRTNVKKCKQVHNVKPLGNVTNSVMKVTANLEIDADFLTKRPLPVMVAMTPRPMPRRTLRRSSKTSVRLLF